MSTLVEQETQGTALIVREPEQSGSIAAFASPTNYEAAKRMALALSQSTLVPKEYQGQGGVANCLVAMELAGRTGASVLMVMQNLHVIQGRPSWSAAFLVASINSCGRFSPIRYEFEGREAQDGWRCRAYARDLASGDVLHGEWITWEMVKAEGWLSKSGSKWKTMPGQMMRYRAAAFWCRTYAPEISFGMHTSEEASDIPARGQPAPATRDLNAAIARLAEAPAAVVEEATIEPAAAAAPAPGTVCQECGWQNGDHQPTCAFAP